jgi:hypothetical protein
MSRIQIPSLRAGKGDSNLGTLEHKNLPVGVLRYTRPRMKCPHCLVEFHDKLEETLLSADVDGGWAATWQRRPKCLHLIIYLTSGPPIVRPGGQQLIAINEPRRTALVHPRGAMRPPCPLLRRRLNQS